MAPFIWLKHDSRAASRGPEGGGPLHEAGSRIQQHSIPNLAGLGGRETQGAGNCFFLARTMESANKGVTMVYIPPIPKTAEELTGHEIGCDCAVCDDIAFRQSLRGKPYTEPAAMDVLRQKVQAKHDANCLLRLLLETLPIQLEKHSLTHDRTACAMLIQDSIDYLFRDGEDTLIESPSNDEQQILKLAYMAGQTTEQKLSEHIRRESDMFKKALHRISCGTLEPGHLYEQAIRMQDIAREALAGRP